jgi:hypothetical protein
MSRGVSTQGETRKKALRCPRCGSEAVRRSMPRTGFERLVRAWTPYHYFLCRDCEYRGAHLGAIPASGAHSATGLTSRPVEVRDRQAQRRQMKRVASAILLASLLGAASGLYLHGCHREAELRSIAPPAE